MLLPLKNQFWQSLGLINHFLWLILGVQLLYSFIGYYFIQFQCTAIIIHHHSLLHFSVSGGVLNFLLSTVRALLSGDDLFSVPKASQSFSNSNLRHLWHSSDSNCLPVPEMLQSSSYSEPLPAVPNTTTCSFHPSTSPDISSKGCSETVLKPSQDFGVKV